MSDKNQHDQDRWRELHELLGLPQDAPKPAAPSAAPPAAPEPAPVEHAEYIAAESPLPDEDRDVEAPPPALEAGMASDEDRTLPPADLEEIPETLEEEPTLPATPPEPEENRDDDDRPRRGRRRGRRGRRSRSRHDEAAPQRIDSDDTEVEPLDDAADAPMAGARREFGAGSDDLPDEADVEEEEVGAAPEGAVEDDDDDEPVETFADWNVPSWQEIVDSLYRPER